MHVHVLKTRKLIVTSGRLDPRHSTRFSPTRSADLDVDAHAAILYEDTMSTRVDVTEFCFVSFFQY